MKLGGKKAHDHQQFLGGLAAPRNIGGRDALKPVPFRGEENEGAGMSQPRLHGRVHGKTAPMSKKFSKPSEG